MTKRSTHESLIREDDPGLRGYLKAEMRKVALEPEV